MANHLGTPMMGTDPKTWKWVQVAEVGKFKGHPSGEFELNPELFGQVVANFKRDGIPIPWDLEHASEQESTSGTIPVSGAPAQGWIHDLDNRGPAGLWALSEWGRQAKDYIRAGQYKFCSPALRFKSKDRVTGQPIGARLTSVAMTNQPYLTGLQTLAAKDAASNSTVDRGTEPGTYVVTLGGSTSNLVHSPHEYMPTIKQALKLTPLSTAAECSQHLDRLRDLCMSNGPDGMHEGTSLSEYVKPLGQLVGATPGMTWDDVFDRVEDLIDHAIEQHEAEYHAGDVRMSAVEPTTESTHEEELTPMAANTEETSVALKDAQSTVTKLQTDVTTLKSERDAFAVQLKDAQTALSTAQAAVTNLTTKATELEGKLTDLSAWKSERVEADIRAGVEVAFATYKDQKNLKDADKEHMLSIAKNAPKAFDAMYPFVPEDQRHLLRTATPTLVRDPKDAQQSVSLMTLAKEIMVKNPKMSFADAQIEASQQLSGDGK